MIINLKIDTIELEKGTIIAASEKDGVKTTIRKLIDKSSLEGKKVFMIHDYDYYFESLDD